MSWAFALALALSVEDPRVELVELQLEDRPDAALQKVEALLAADQDAARRLGLDYLRGHLLSRQGRSEEASQAFASALLGAPQLVPFSRFRLAQEEEKLGHPEVAAGLVATLLGSAPPPSLVPEAVSMLRRTLRRGGDCRLLNGIPAHRFGTAEKRNITYFRATCALRRGETEKAEQEMLGLLQEATADETAREAVEWVASGEVLQRDRQVRLLVGLTFHDHREFDRSIQYLHMALEGPGSAAANARKDFEARYAMVRSSFWLGDYRQAAAGFAELAGRTNVPKDRARVLFQQGRSLELLGEWKLAANAFRQTFNADPNGSWAPAALLAAMRLEWRSGEEASATELYELLTGRSGWRTMAARASLFLAASDLVEGRAERADPWLDQAESSGRSQLVEAAYWRGRQLEVLGSPAEAVERYLKALRYDPYHPLSQAAAERLAQPSLAETAQARGRQLARSRQVEDLHGAWILLKGSAAGETVRQRLTAILAADGQAAPYLAMAPVPVEEWPLWRSTLRRPEELLLALGIWGEGAPAVQRLFPPSDPSLALTGCQLLTRGRGVHRSLRLAEILSQRVPKQVPPGLLPKAYREVLYPFSHGDMIVDRAQAFRVDPFLLAAVIREESHFDAEALSAASARGLTQFVMPTARRLSAKLQLGPLQPTDLYDPAISITLGAAYLAELSQQFENEHQMAAAYNAGEPQARLWRGYCSSDDPAEYFSKVGFRETRSYLRKVLSSRAQYRELYGELAPQQVALSQGW